MTKLKTMKFEYISDKKIFRAVSRAYWLICNNDYYSKFFEEAILRSCQQFNADSRIVSAAVKKRLEQVGVPSESKLDCTVALRWKNLLSGEGGLLYVPTE